MEASPTKILHLLQTVSLMIMFTAQDIAISNGQTVTNNITLMMSLSAVLTFLSIALSPYDNKEFKRWLSWKFGIRCLFASMVALSVTVFQNQRGTLDPLKKSLFLFMVPLSVMLFQILEAENIFPQMRNKAGNSRAVKHHELLTNNHEKLLKEDCEFERRMIFGDLEMATMFMSITFYLVFSMRKEAPSLLMVTLVLPFVTSFASVLIFSVIIALGVTKGTFRKLPMRCGHVLIFMTLALLGFAYIVASFQNWKGTVG